MAVQDVATTGEIPVPPPTESALATAPEPAPQSRPPAPTPWEPHYFETRLNGIAIEAVAFDSRSHHLKVADQPQGPGTRWPDSRSAGKGSLAAINASFFTPEGQPLGMIVTAGQPHGAINRASSLGSGFYVEENSGKLRLIRRDQFDHAKEAIQAGPFLVENRRAVRGLSQESSAARSFLAHDNAGHWILARTGPCSLAELAQALAGARLGPVKIHQALNLDGGRSSEIWVSSAIQGGPAFTRPFWNKPVRNFLTLQPR
nr:phosphodiester glycosidase family protein [Haloferula luteola]